MRLLIRLRRAGGGRPWSRSGRLVFLLVFAVAVSVMVRSLFGERGLVEWWRLRAEERRLEKTIAVSSLELEREMAAVRALRQGGVAVERVAREQLGLARPGEVVYYLPEASGAERSAPPAPDSQP